MLYSVIDIETTGLDVYRDSPLTFTALTINEKDEVVRAEHLYFYEPSIITLNPEAEKVHGITKDILTPHIPEFWSNVKRMFNIVSYANMIGYNSIAFDYRLIFHFLRRCGLQPFDLLSHTDVMTMCGKKRQKLTSVCDQYHITPELLTSLVSKTFNCDGTKAHDSRYDVIATYLLYSILK